MTTKKMQIFCFIYLFLVRDEMELHLIHDTSRQQYRWSISEAVNTVKCSWWWTKTSPETCGADYE